MMVKLIKTYINPTLSEALEIISKAVSSKELTIIVGECSVDYQGRSESRLTLGERVIIIKQDGAFLVHRPTGYSPVNWQPATSIIETRLDKDKLIIMAVRRKPRETIWVYLTRIYTIITGKLVDNGEFIMYMDEHEIRDILYEHPELIEEGLKIIEKEKKIGEGYADLFGIDARNTPVIIEIKRVTATREAMLQLYNYVQTYQKQTGVKPRGILVAPTITSSAIESAYKLGLEWKEINLQKIWKYRKNKNIKHGTLFDFLKNKR
ncbi:protein of unknown function DUF91 [Staphylothermus marinus F1]|uniref:Endonuclease NucS n=2 Tax=Staphylothermus marinus TaxID=2280 RepID=A3DP33_STAMF|nr:protein of unknown function DUF91 [Staphylothermus marinus F1]